MTSCHSCETSGCPGRDVDHPRKCHQEGSSAGGGGLRRLETLLSPNCREHRRKWRGARRGKDGVTPRKRATADLFSTPGTRWKPGGTPEAKKPPGMAGSSEGLEVARVEVKAPMEATGKVSVTHSSRLRSLGARWGASQHARLIPASMAALSGPPEI